MKLICEDVRCEYQVLTESINGKPHLTIRGVFAMADRPTLNNRVYPRQILKRAMEKYITEKVKNGRAVGHLGKPEGVAIDLDKVSHRITEIKHDKDIWTGKAIVLNNKMGDIVKGIFNGGGALGISQRSLASIREDSATGRSFVGDDLSIHAFDITDSPSFTDGFIQGIMEGQEFLMVNEMIGGRMQKVLKRMSTREIEENKVRMLVTFLDAMVKA